MKMFRHMMVLFIASAFIFSCSKSNDSATGPDSVKGEWIGKYGNDNETPSVFFSYKFKDGGVLEEIDQSGEVKGTGTWKMENNILTGYTINVKAPVGNKYSMIGAYNASQKKILGNWGYGSSATNGGLWEMTKQN